MRKGNLVIEQTSQIFDDNLVELYVCKHCHHLVILKEKHLASEQYLWRLTRCCGNNAFGGFEENYVSLKTYLENPNFDKN